MSEQFDPQPISLRDALDWFKSATLLILRRPLYFVLPILPAAVFGGEVVQFLIIFPLYFLLVFTVLLSVSQRVDTSQPLRPQILWQQLKHCLGLNAGLFAGMLVLRVVVVLMVIYDAVPTLLPETAVNIPPEWAANLLELSSSGMILLIFFQYTHGWFRHALRLFHELPADLAQQLSRKATLLNFYVLWQVSMGLLLVYFLTFFIPLWVEFTLKMALLIILPPYLYVAYRHIFLGKKANAALVTRQREQRWYRADQPAS
ncbi:MAG: hypothetical protein HY080_05250 [Gammaproteobacteria bacterium]|nr:hypothetical protein [Gammaproteobacteria bacterium]